MVSKHKIDMAIKWHERGYDIQLIAHHLGLDPRAVQDILQQANQPTTRAGKPQPPEFSDAPLWEEDRP